MKKMVIACLLFSLFSVFSQELVVAADYWMPYNGDPGSEKEGFVVEILKEIFEKKGITVKYETRPWARAIKLGEEGKVDAVIGAMKSDAEGFVFPEESIGILANDFYVPADSDWKFTGFESFKGYKVGIVTDYAYGDEVDKFISENKSNFDYVAGENAIEMNIKKLAHKRIDILMDTKFVVDFTANNIGLTDKIKYAGDDGSSDKIYVAFSPAKSTSKDYADYFDVGMKELRKSGELGKILKKYGLSDWK